MAKRRVCLVGAGFISEVHAEAIAALPNARVAAVVDPNQAAAKRLANKWSVPNIFGSVEEAIESGQFDAAHILVPPTLHHDVASAFLDAGKPVLLEKPMATSSADCESLNDLAAQRNTVLGINQNFVYHPAFARLRSAVAARELGPLEFVNCIYSVPLRQLGSGQLGHWMFHEPGNILLEQAVHPLSQMVSLLGPVDDLAAKAEPAIEISPGVSFHKTLGMTISGAKGAGQLHFQVGSSFGFWQITAGCTDGILVADILANRYYTHERGNGLEQVDGYFSGRKTGRAIARDARRNVQDFMLSTLRLKAKADPFYVSMKGSLGAFHDALDQNQSPLSDGKFGGGLVTLCEQAAKSAFKKAPGNRSKTKAPKLTTKGRYDVALLGGTGFIGGHTVRAFLNAGKTVGVMARNVRNLAPVFFEDGVVVVRGDVTNPDDVSNAIGDAKTVVNLAHGGGGANWEEIKRAMVDSGSTVGQICLDKGVERLVQVGSIAGLYLGDSSAVITGATPVDPRSEERADYSRAKAESDKALLDLHRTKGLPVCIVRPGVVVGAGGLPFHSGLGNFNNEQHCVGWNDGLNPLPFVLVEDVADAIVRACTADGVDGKCYNLVGEVEMSAQAYVTALAQALHRPIRFHPQSVAWFQAGEIFKWLVKRAGGRKVGFPSYRDLKSRGMVSRFDVSDAKHDLGWEPVSDRGAFIRHGADVYASSAD